VRRDLADLAARFEKQRRVARKLLVALWKYSTSGVVIEGAVMKTI
jgi:hypothetical protein